VRSPATGAEVYPPDEALARWILVLQLARNDLELAGYDIEEAAEAAEAGRDSGNLLRRSRIAAGHLYEAAVMLRRSHQEVAEVRDFARTLPEELRAEYQPLRDASFLSGVLEPDRNLTFHYPGIVEDQRGYDELKEAMEKLAGEPVELLVEGDESGKPRRFRHAFPDLVAAEFAVGAFGTTEREWEEAAGRIKDALSRFVRIVDRITEQYWRRGGD
jgi:hypothetical protein